MKKRNAFLFLMLAVITLFLSNCSEDETINPKAGNLILKLTDAASDDKDIKGIYITISSVKVNGKPVRNYIPQTIDISALRNGETETIIDKDLPAKEYDQISLVLAAHNDNSENTPGCYVLTKDNRKHNLMAGGSAEIELILSKAFELIPGEVTRLVVDFDLRKAVIRAESGESGYRFVTNQELENAIRIIDEKQTGNIAGTVSTHHSDEFEIYILIYNEGVFKAAVEGTGTGKSKILFPNAVTSTKMEPDGSYFLSFLEEGNYEIRLAAFKRNNSNVFSFYGFVPTTSRRTGMLLNNIQVLPGSEIELDIEIFRLAS